ncbi:MAG: hypothetical protein GXC72_04530 [Chitinophagaceae bacterium]|nr:hypothetical protein [Chitinophagaceae bacterium]
MIYLRVVPQEGVSFEEFVIEYNKNLVLQKFDIGIIQERHLFDREKIIEILFEKGQTSILKQEVLLEFFIPKGTAGNVIVGIIQKYLDKVTIDNELIIVDPYFFLTRHGANYSSFIASILGKYLPTIDTIRIITGTRFNATIKTQIYSDLHAIKSTLTIIHSQSDDYHDRYWISNNREKGLIIGTSLNGLGNKYALIDRLNTTDVRDIIAELTAGGLI